MVTVGDMANSTQLEDEAKVTAFSKLGKGYEDPF